MKNICGTVFRRVGNSTSDNKLKRPIYVLKKKCLSKMKEVQKERNGV